MSLFQKINKQHPVRRSEKQKQDFIDFVKKSITTRKVTVDVADKHNNLIIGDFEKAEVIFTAHYDTPARSLVPNLMIPKNTFLNKVYHYGIFILLALISLALSFFLSTCFNDSKMVFIISYLLLYFSSFYLLTRAFENKHNANDNTSGIATLFEIIKRRNDKKVAFILFDNEEKGLLGSKAFNKKYANILKDKLVINLDCVGNGDHFLFIVKKKAFAHKLFEKLNFACKSDKAFNFEFIEFEKASSNSDYKNFECGIGLSAYTKSKNGMLITGKIHTKNDTFINEKNIEILSEKLVKFIDLI